jgi:hypothetical protein
VMASADIRARVERMRDSFATGVSRDVKWRKAQISALLRMVGWALSPRVVGAPV